MARILVTGDHSSVAGRDAIQRLVQRMRSDGHDAFAFGAEDEDVAAAVRGCDAVVGILDRIEAGGAALMAYAHAQQKPVLGLAGEGAAPHDVFQEIATIRTGSDVDGWLRHLHAFYDDIRPYSGRVVRDRIPELVKQAGHDVTFRRLSDKEKPRFLKQKIANEAQELLRADLAEEKEEIGDVLEAMEAFILSRGFDRDDLRRVKEAKRKRRGGFEQGYVVESTVHAPDENGEGSPPAAEATEGPGDAEDGAGHEGHREAGAAGPTATDAPPADGRIDFEYDDEPADEDRSEGGQGRGAADKEPENLAPGQDVRGRFRDV